jgi:hypothetical protein
VDRQSADQEADDDVDEHDDMSYYLNNAPSDYGSDAPMGDLPAYMNIGVIPTTSEQDNGIRRIITFPNWVQCIQRSFCINDGYQEDRKPLRSLVRCP